MQRERLTTRCRGTFVPEKRKCYFYPSIVIDASMNPLATKPFPAADKPDWRTQLQKELKSETSDEDLRWQTHDGFVAEPYYTADDLRALPLETIQAAQKQTPGWHNTPEYQLTNNAKADNTRLHDALSRGADALMVNLTEQAVPTKTKLSRLLGGVKLSDTPVFFRVPADAVVSFVQTLKTVAPYQLKGGLLVETGDVPAEAVRQLLDSPRFRTVCVGSHDFHNAGATATQELAFTLARLTDVYDQLTDAGLTPEQLVSGTMLSVSVGTGYFLEIAKLRALRVLMNHFLSAYPTSYSTPHTAYIHVQTSTFYDARTTPYTNLIRATTEAMSAVIGGCDALTVHPYDTVLNQSADPEFAERIARNVSVLLKEESYLDKVADPSAGSYYVESLTHQLVESAWALFLRVGQMGGLAKAFAAGFVQEEIERAYRAKGEAVQNGRVLVGVTKFRHGAEPDPTAAVPEKTVGLLPDRRLAEEFE